jgi:hypothetical protein
VSNLAPLIPRFIAEQCICHNDESGVLAWSIHDIGVIQGFILELDNGTIGSEFRVKDFYFSLKLIYSFRKSMMVMKQYVQLMVFFHHVFIQHE